MLFSILDFGQNFTTFGSKIFNDDLTLVTICPKGHLSEFGQVRSARPIAGGRYLHGPLKQICNLSRLGGL